MSDLLLVLEDGRSFLGRRFGAESDSGGEVVFNTCMTGYQEILGDPSYAKQIVVMTYPMMGNYGIAAEDFESRSSFVAGLVVKEASPIAANWRHERTLADYMEAQNISGCLGIDTRALVRHLRTHGSQRGVLGDPKVGVAALQARARELPSMSGLDLATVVSTKKIYHWTNPGFVLGNTKQSKSARDDGHFHVVAYDFGVKWSILRKLVSSGCRVTVVPAATSAQDVLDLKPDGVLLSNGPGDPQPLAYATASVQKLLGRLPIFGICLGHQILGLASGAKTYKLKFGHRGGNHPVLNTASHKVEITSHNHGFAIAADSLPNNVEVTHLNLNDQTIEGVCRTDVPAFSVQYHPEAAPGPHDADYLFARFLTLMREQPRSKL